MMNILSANPANDIKLPIKRMRISVILSLLGLLLLITSSCNGNSSEKPLPTPFFPVQKPGLPSLLLKGRGELILENNCLRLRLPNGESNLAIWPYGYSVRVEGNIIQIINEKGEAIARVGDTIKYGGGPANAEMAANSSSQPLSEDCPGSYWIVSEIIDR
jgi:hypothetical protein